MSFLNGKPAKSTSENVAYPWLQQQYGGTVGTGTAANDQLSALLGIGGDQGAAQQGYQNFLNSTGYNNVVDQAMRGVSGSMAARGLLGSGATAKALQNRAAGLGQQYYTNYLGQLGDVANRGMQAGSLIGGAGQRSTSSGATQGLLGTIGQIGQAAAMIPMFSDRRLKTDIVKLGELEDGLGVYSWRYLWNEAKRHVGVIAQEVQRLRPWALGPRVGGFMTVNYSALSEAQ